MSYNSEIYGHVSQQQLFATRVTLDAKKNPANRFVYFKQNFNLHTSVMPDPVKVLINPNFKQKVFVNPNFNANVNNGVLSNPVPKIHVNPNAHSIKHRNDTRESATGNTIHVNPNILRNVPVSANHITAKASVSESNSKGCDYKEVNRTIISTRTKLVRSSGIRKRRSSIKSQFKLIKSSVLEKSVGAEKTIGSKYKIVKAGSTYAQQDHGTNKFKVDHRHKTLGSTVKNKKYVYVNRFLSISDMARNGLLKQNKNRKLLEYSGVFKKSPINSKKTTNLYKKINNTRKSQGSFICKSKYKLTNKNQKAETSSVTVSPSKISRKFGKCKGKENGKCSRKHDPEQIALCTKFLQGACVDDNCLLSHNVSPEKMPTCKFYLEGSCSRESCPYLHVRINPKADVCKDFLEGFCKKAAQCDKRHQFLCPDYEKNGSCQKQRCPYPHGRMVRKYSVFNKNKFAKKSSKSSTTKVEIKNDVIKNHSDDLKLENLQGVDILETNPKSRYYTAQNNLESGEKTCNNNQDDVDNCEQERGIKSRPKLGKLPSFIAFEDI
ncbi:hypothetical protein NQ315_004094 [Exocentrus adspersus]|uniref:Zinc finger CCCH domain-containing protein 3 n=1 Tax=Exocentrus adspersus TaxID=1586481 RepID=A0AAV8W6T3_9CUCU|nr:hypothetical protein NQ315_004094 [Exocentrus adspersus]